MSFRHHRRTIAALAATLTTCLAGPATADAAVTVECVGFDAPAADCTTSHPAGSLQAAIDAVATDGDADVVRLAPGTWSGPVLFATTDADVLEGAGRELTTLRNENADTTVGLNVQGLAGQTVTVRDLRVEREFGVSLSRGVQGIRMRLERVDVELVSPTANSIAIFASIGTTIDDVDVDVRGANLRAVYINTGPVLIEDSSLRTSDMSTATGIHGGADVTIRRTVIGGVDGTGAFGMGISLEAAQVVVEDSLVNLGSRGGAIGVQVANGNAGTQALGLDVRRSTIRGSGGTQRGIIGRSDNAGEVLTFKVSGSVIHLTGSSPVDIRCHLVSPGSITAKSIGHTAFSGDVWSPFEDCAVPQVGTVDTTGLTAAQLFNGPASNDWRPLPGGPLVGAGDPALGAGGTDVRGAARVVDGVHDIGAYEYQHVAPQVQANATPSSVAPGTAVAFTAAASDPIDGEQVTVQGWTFGDGTSTSDASPAHAYAAVGTYTATVTVVDSSGMTAAATVDVTVAVPPAPPAAPTGTTETTEATTTTTTATTNVAATTDTVAPTLVVRSPLLASRRSGLALRVAARTGRTISLQLGERSTVRVTIARKVGTRWVALRGSQALTLAAGTRHLAWGGRWAGATLATGRYRVTFVARDAAGNRSAARSTTVTLVA